MSEYEHPKAFAAEKRRTKKRLEVGPKDDDVVEARRHGYTSGAVSERVASPSGALTRSGSSAIAPVAI